jgi:hypothetical protein
MGIAPRCHKSARQQHVSALHHLFWPRVRNGSRAADCKDRKLVALTHNTAVIETPTGARQTYHRRSAETTDVVLAWELEE